MSDSLRTNKAKVLPEWNSRFMDLAEQEDGYALEAFNRVTRSNAERLVALELLFHHVNRNYGLGVNSKPWQAFRSKLDSLRRRSLSLASELQRLHQSRIFSTPLILAAFLARERGTFVWEQTVQAPRELFLSSTAKELKQLCGFMRNVIIEGDKIWNFRHFGSLNLILLSIYLKQTTGEWRDEEIGALLRIAYKAAGQRWKSEKNPGSAIAMVRQRFRTAQSRLERLHSAVYPVPTKRRRSKKLSAEPSFKKRSGNQDSKKRDLDRGFLRRHTFNDLHTMVQSFVGLMEAGETKDVNDSLLEYLNLCMVLELKSWTP